MKRFLCWLGFHKYYCKIHPDDDGRMYFNCEFECKYCQKIEKIK